MKILHYSKDDQAYGAFNGGEIIENKPLGFPQDGGKTQPYSNLFYWANAVAVKDSTIGLHPHKGFEIMSFVLSGKIKHYDSQIKEWKELSAGDVQIIRAGNGISHAEFMQKDARMFQIWFDPNLNNSLAKPASYDDYSSDAFSATEYDTYSKKTYVGEQAPIKMDTLVGIYEIESHTDSVLQLKKNRHYSFYVLEGSGIVDKQAVAKDDFVICKDAENLKLSAGLKLFVVSAEQEMSYKTYGQSMSN